jgi:hypothetical protein
MSEVTTHSRKAMRFSARATGYPSLASGAISPGSRSRVTVAGHLCSKPGGTTSYATELRRNALLWSCMAGVQFAQACASLIGLGAPGSPVGASATAWPLRASA